MENSDFFLLIDEMKSSLISCVKEYSFYRTVSVRHCKELQNLVLDWTGHFFLNPMS